jgi:hypothetical protein
LKKLCEEGYYYFLDDRTLLSSWGLIKIKKIIVVIATFSLIVGIKLGKKLQSQLFIAVLFLSFTIPESSTKGANKNQSFKRALLRFALLSNKMQTSMDSKRKAP